MRICDVEGDGGLQKTCSLINETTLRDVTHSHAAEIDFAGI